MQRTIMTQRKLNLHTLLAISGNIRIRFLIVLASLINCSNLLEYLLFYWAEMLYFFIEPYLAAILE